MKRDIAINLAKINKNKATIINMIFDDFEKQICKTCKSNLNNYRCNSNGSMVEFLDVISYPDFGCNQWVKK